MQDTRTHRGRWTATLIVTLVALIASVVPASAEGGQSDADAPPLPPFVTVTGQDGRWTTFEAPIARVYGNGMSADGFVAITNGELADVCSNTPPPTGEGRFRQKKDGTWVVRTARGGIKQTVTIYETDLDVFAFFDQQCPLFGAGDPALAQPYATGWVVLRDKSWDLAEPFPMEQLGRFKNSIRGYAWDGDGQKYRIRAVADYEVDAEGELTFFRDFLKVRPVTYR